MKKESLEVLCVTESLLSSEKLREVKRVFNEYDVFVSQRKSKKKRVNYKERGGIMCISKKECVKIEKKCESDDMLCLNWRGTTLICAYFVPPTSPYVKTNEKRMIEIQQIVMEKEERVIIVTDSNGWIGELPSRVSTLVDGNMSDERIYERKSERTDVNTQGKWFIDSMNSVNMVIMNGIKSRSEYTYDHLGREARSIVDYVVVKEGMMNEVSKLSYVDYRCTLQTDHKMICVQVQHTRVRREEGKDKEEKEDHKETSDGVSEGSNKKGPVLEGISERV